MAATCSAGVYGNIPGTMLLKSGDAVVIKLLFGVVVMSLGIEMFFREYHKSQKKSSPVILGLIGLLSGLLCGLFGIEVLLAAYISRRTKDNHEFRKLRSESKEFGYFEIQSDFRFFVFESHNMFEQ